MHVYPGTRVSTCICELVQLVAFCNRICVCVCVYELVYMCVMELSSPMHMTYSGVTVVIQWCYSGVTVVLVVLQWCYGTVKALL
jgi:hypothetical protein